MPLSKSGKKILKNMRKEYGSDKKAKQVFYSSINKNKSGSEKWHLLGRGMKRGT